MSLELLELLYNATRSRYGTVVETDDAERLRQKFYALRRGNDDFKHLSFLISPANGSDLWILNKGNPDAQE